MSLFLQILVTHHVGLCLPAAEYVVRMSSGRVVFQGPVSELDKAELVKEVVEEEREQLQDALEEIAIPTPAAEDSAPETRTASPSGVKAKGDGKLTDAEANAEGRVAGKVYRTYLSAAGYSSWLVILVLLLAGRALRVVDRYWCARSLPSAILSDTLSGSRFGESPTVPPSLDSASSSRSSLTPLRPPSARSARSISLPCPISRQRATTSTRTSTSTRSFVRPFPLSHPDLGTHALVPQVSSTLPSSCSAFSQDTAHPSRPRDPSSSAP